jgi:hypothetical protein
MSCTEGFRTHGGYPYILGCLDGRQRSEGDDDSDVARCCFVATLHEHLSALTVRSTAARANPIGLDGLPWRGPPDRSQAMPAAGCRSPGATKVCPTQALAPCARPASI